MGSVANKKAKFKIVGICQIYNELEKGNLKRFIKYILPLVDELVVYDDASTDGSYEYIKKFTNHVIRAEKNDFADEVNHRKILLEKALSLKPDFILRLDADEVLTEGAKEKLQEVCADCENHNLDAVEFHRINIWRSKSWQRIDSLFDAGWEAFLWRVTPELGYKQPIRKGLHQKALVPPSVKKRSKTDEIAVLHYGFADEVNLAYKFLVYRSHGQRGYEMLDRLISEESLELKRIPKKLFPRGLYEDDEKPKAMSYVQSLKYAESYSERVFKPKYSIVCLIYKSVDWLKFINEQVLKYTDLTDKEFFFVANDADQEVLDYLKNNYIKHYVFNNTPSNKKQWYINNVYRAWNFGAKCAKGDFVVFINSDMGLSPGWFEDLLNRFDGSNCVASRLVESGKLRSASPAISKNFGRTIKDYKEEKFIEYASAVKEDAISSGGLFMPLLIRKEHFLKIGGYPEGNIIKGSNLFKPRIAKQSDKLISGDVVLMEKLRTIGVKHVTSFSSVVYHFQCGEMDEKKSSASNDKIEIAIANDIAGGSMGERVLWNYMLEKLPGAYALDYKSTSSAYANFPKNAKKFISEFHPQTKIIIQNGTFIKKVSDEIFTISLVQDDLRQMKRVSIEQEANLKSSQKVVANSIGTAASYREFAPKIIPIGLDEKLFKPLDKKKLRDSFGYKMKDKIGIFVGSFSSVKGWDEVKSCIKKNKDIKWILVTKKDEQFSATNVEVYNRVKQEKLAELLNLADFFILGSPVETQCLAALEAALCDIPLVMHKVGIFDEFEEAELKQLGYFGKDLNRGIGEVLKNKLNPRKVIVSRKLTIEATINAWKNLIEQSVLQINVEKLHNLAKPASRRKPLLRAELFLRKKIIKRLIGREYFSYGKYFTVNFVIGLVVSFLRVTGLLVIVKKILRKK